MLNGGFAGGNAPAAPGVRSTSASSPSLPGPRSERPCADPATFQLAAITLPSSGMRFRRATRDA